MFISVTDVNKFDASSGKDRPLKVSIDKRETRGGILRNSYKLKNNSKLKKVGIGRDLTKKQREVSKVIRKDLLKIRVDQPGKNWGIRRDKIVELPINAHMPLHIKRKVNIPMIAPLTRLNSNGLILARNIKPVMSDSINVSSTREIIGRLMLCR